MDRLTTLMERFHLSVKMVPMAEANFLAFAGDGGQPQSLVFYPQNEAPAVQAPVVMSARAEWQGNENPFLSALPEVVDYDLSDDASAQNVVRLICEEASGGRCGAQSVVSRLGEVLMVRLMRGQIMRGTAEPGLLAGLADPRLSRAIVAIHDHPGRDWSNGDLAAEAGLSLSRFTELFAAQVGETPIGYLRRWRLTLARQDLIRGDRVEAVARRYAYSSPEGFSRAFRKEYGVAPISLRSAAA